MSDFASLGLSPALVRAAGELGYEAPTPIQVTAIPAALAGQDLMASAETGSGKTAAYVFPVLQRADGVLQQTRRGPRRAQTLVLVPTRELAMQVGESMRLVRRFLSQPVKVSILFGGVSINPQLMDLRGGVDVVIATPGRLLDVVAHNALDLSAVSCLVLDEADRLLDGGFADELKRVLTLLPPRRQNLLFSATFPATVQRLVKELLHEPTHVDIPRAPVALATIEQHAIEVDPAQRTPLLRHLIQKGSWSRVLVFVATRYACDHVAEKLRKTGIEAAAFHGDASQGARTRVLADFKASKLQVLVATDLGARGIDIAQLPVVVNYDLPRSAVDYVHRIGRTARAGESGLAVSFIGASDEAHGRLIDKRQGHRGARERIEGFEPTETATPEAAAGGVKGKRPNKKDKLRAAGLR
ncbi:MAG: DEAD/DEAH box helicase [Rhizobacter sp.]